ncbi:MAG: ATPase, partial [Parasporobacterium sp.]|nr:ATPase [Parasporobacterium sp.]
IFLGLTYSFIFGAMFGDLGHGLVLLIGGALIYFIKKSQLAGIISCAGFFSSIFGVLFGSVFGFENIIEPLWLSPMKAMSTLNFVGRIKTVFVLAVAFGMFLMLVLMIINIISSIKQKDFKSCIFSQNGIAGFVFYGSLTLVVFLFMGNKPLPASIILVLLLGVPALCIALKEPLTNLLNKKKALETGVGMFCIEAFFDLFEVCLTFLSNTLSYLRIGAFALSHAAMMEVVLSLTGYAEGGQGSIVGLILGNVVVIGFEGLIVGIQVLRLEYYEFFSRFYKGSGRAFTPYFKKRRDI